MKYFKKANGQVFAFELDGSQDAYITDDMIQMTDEEVDRHIHPENHFSEEEKYKVYLKSLKPLTHRQFMITLVEFGLDDDLSNAIDGIEDSKQKKIINIEFNSSQNFERLNDSVLFMFNLINFPEDKINEFWEYGMKL